MAERVDYFAYCVDNFFIRTLNSELLEEKAANKLADLMAMRVFASTNLANFVGADYCNMDRLHIYLTVLLAEGLKKVGQLSKTPVVYLRSLVDWSLLLKLYSEHVGLLAKNEPARPDSILFIDTLVQLFDSPWDQSRILSLKLLLEDLASNTEVLERIELAAYRASPKVSLEDISVAMLKNPDIHKYLQKLYGKLPVEFDRECFPLLEHFSEYYMLKLSSRLGPSCDFAWGRILPTGMIIFHELALPLTSKKKSAPLAMAKAAFTILHEKGNYVKRILRDGGKVFPRLSIEESEDESEFTLEKVLFSRYNTLHLLADARPSNKSIINKISKIVLTPELWEESNFCYTIKNMVLQVHCKETIGFDTLNPTFKRRKCDIEPDEPVIIIKEPLSKHCLVTNNADIIAKKEEA